MATVLVLDDDPQICRALERILKSHAVRSSTDPARVVEELRSGARYDVIFCDGSMPGLNGLAFRDAVLAIDGEQARRIVFVTGRAFDSGPNRCIAKPFDPAELRAIVTESGSIKLPPAG